MFYHLGRSLTNLVEENIGFLYNGGSKDELDDPEKDKEINLVIRVEDTRKEEIEDS